MPHTPGHPPGGRAEAFLARQRLSSLDPGLTSQVSPGGRAEAFLSDLQSRGRASGAQPQVLEAGLVPEGFWGGLFEIMNNAYPSTVQLGKDVAGMLNPKTWVAMKDMIATPEGRSQFLEVMKSQYGSVDGGINYMQQDPAAFLSDVAGLISLGATAGLKTVAKGGTMATKFAKAQSFANTIDPITGVPILAGQAIKKLPDVQSLLTGLSSDVHRANFDAGRTGGNVADSWRTHFAEGNIIEKQRKIVERVQGAMDKIRKTAHTQYQQKMGAMVSETVKVDDLQKALDDVKKQFEQETVGGKMVTGSDTGNLFRQLQDEVDRFKKAGSRVDPLLNNVINVDLLKQELFRMRGADPKANKILANFSTSVKDLMATQAPEYTKIMGDYGDVMGELDLYMGELANGKALDTQQFKKIMSVTRDNVNTGFGARVELLNTLDPAIHSDLSAMASAFATPTGLTKHGAMGSIAYGAGLAINDRPGLGAMVATLGPTAFSPSFNAMTNFNVGRGVNKIDNFVAKIPDILTDNASMAYDFGNTIRRLERPVQRSAEEVRLMEQYLPGGRLEPEATPPSEAFEEILQRARGGRGGP
jgi:hypothetical protein